MRRRHAPGAWTIGSAAHRAGVLQIRWRTSCTSTACSSRARGVRVRRASARAAAGDRFARGCGRRRRARARPHRLGRPPCRAASTARRASMPRAGRSTWAPTTARFYAVDPAAGSDPLDLPRPRARSSARPRSAATWSTSATAADRVVALDAGTGKWRWQYEREMPEGFTIHGYAGPRLRGDAAAGRLRRRLLRVADGGSGEVVVGAVAGRGVRPVRRRRFDAGRVGDDASTSSSYSGGLYALDAARRQRALARWASRASAPSRRRRTACTSWRRARGCTPRTPTVTSCGGRG